MHRLVNHHAYPRRGFAPICELLASDAADPLSEATRAAAEFADLIADEVRGLSEFFDVDEDVRIEYSPLRRHHGSASLDLEWSADPSKRLLPNVRTTLEINPILPEGPHAISEILLNGEYHPPDVHRRGVAEFFLERRVVNAALHVFLDRLVSGIEERS